MDRVRIDYNGKTELSKYRELPKLGFSLAIHIGDKGGALVLEGQTASKTILSIQQFVHESEGIHVENQRLFVAGEELDPTKTLGDYCINKHCLLKVKSYIPVLVSTLEAPGPMLTEVEVCARRDESVRNIKRKLYHKIGIPMDEQRLYLSPDEMTSFSRRRQLDDFSLIKRYLPPSCGGGIIEVRHTVAQTVPDHSIIFRLPITVQDARKVTSTPNEITTTNDSKDEPNKPYVPYKFNTRDFPGWLSLDLDTSKIIKRDPLVSDLIRLLTKNLKPKIASTSDADQPIQLKFCQSRTVHNGKILAQNKKSGEDYQIRSHEQLLKVVINDMEAPENPITPMVSAPMPILPMASYNDEGIRYTMPRNPICMSWTVASTEELDLGANPRVVMELSGFSYSKLCGSWDIAEHCKTYVEILIEGTFYVGDVGKNQDILNEFSTKDYSDKSVIYYAQDMMEITITGPENSVLSNPHLVNKNPMNWYRKSAGRRKNENEFWEQTLNRRIGAPTPFRYDKRAINLPSRTKLENNDVTYGHDGPSQLLIDNWYFGKERVSDVTPDHANKGKKKFFDAYCSRGITVSSNPYLKVTFNSRSPTLNSEEQRRAFDFRIQSQFYICTLEEDFNQGKKPEDSKQFVITVGQNLQRTKHVPNYSDVVTNIRSPFDSSMKTTMTITLANNAWVKETSTA